MANKEKKERAIFPDPVVIEIGVGENSETFPIGPLVRKKYNKVFQIVGSIAQGLVAGDTTGIDMDNIMNSIGAFIALAGESLTQIYEIVLDKPVDWIEENMTMAQEFALIEAIFEQNDVEEIVRNFQGMVRRLAPKDRAKK